MEAEILPAERMFDYAELDAETRIVVQQRTSEIRTIARRAATDVIEIGTKLLEVKERLGHGKFGSWLQSEFGWSQDTASRFMSVSTRFSQIPHIAEFAPTALYMLSAPSVPGAARTEAVARATAGERITVKTAQTIIADQYASIEQLTGPVRQAVRKFWPETAKMMLTQVNAMNAAGAEVVERIYGEPTIPKPARRADIRTVCREYLTELNTASRPAAQVVYLTETKTEAKVEAEVEPTGPGIRTQHDVDIAAGKVRWQVRAFLNTAAGKADRTKLEEAKRLTGSILDLEGFSAQRGRNFDWEALVQVPAWPMTEPTSLRRAVEFEREVVLALLAALPEAEVEVEVEVEPEPELDLPTVVLNWLADKVEENALPDGVEESRYVLRKILTDRNNGFALAWRELKTQGHWPAGTQDGAKLDAVKAALAQLGGESPQPPPLPERVYVRPDVVPTTAQAMNEVDRLNKKLRELVELNAKQADRIHGQVVAIDKALGYLKSLAVADEEAIDEDLIETIAALEAAR